MRKSVPSFQLLLNEFFLKVVPLNAGPFEYGLPGFETGSWQGVRAPAGTPPVIVEKLNAELARILNSADMKEKRLVQGAESRSGSPESFGGFISKEKERWAKVVKGAGIKIE